MLHGVAATLMLVGSTVAANAGDDMDGEKATKAVVKAVLPELPSPPAPAKP